MPVAPSGRGLVVTIESGTDELTLIDRFAIAVLAVGLAESVTLTVKVKVPAAVGVPEITPPALSVNAGAAGVGRVPEARVHV